MLREPKIKYDGWVSLIGGQDSGRSPALLDPNQAAELWNVTVRGGYPTNRPGYFQHDLIFPPDGNLEVWFKTKLPQLAMCYKPRDLNPIQVWVVGGRFFTIDILNDGQVAEITPQTTIATTAPFTIPGIGAPVTIHVADTSQILTGTPIQVGGGTFNVASKTGTTMGAINVDGIPLTVVPTGSLVSYLDVNSDTSPQAWGVQAERFLVIQDGLSRPFIFDGSKSWRANPANLEVPTGRQMAYGQGRLWVAINKQEFVAGDIIFGPTGTPTYDFADAILHFTENTFLAEGGSFNIPQESGEITAMQFLPVFDTSTGQGPLIVFTETSANSVNASPIRSTWKDTTTPIKTVLFFGPGPRSQWSTVTVTNGDIFYRSIDGIRSLIAAFRQAQAEEWGNRPLSSEMYTILRDDATILLRQSSAIVFDNRLLMTTGARPDRGRGYFKGLAVLDFHTLSRMGQEAPPVWEGIWVGVDAWQVYGGSYRDEPRAFICARSADGINQLWEISKGNFFDNTDGRILSSVFSRSMNFGGSFELKRLEDGELWIEGIVGQVDFTIKYRSDEYLCWNTWGEAEACAQFRNCDRLVDCAPIAATFRPGYKTRVGFGQPPDTDENNDFKPARLGYEFSVFLQWEGKATVKKARFKVMEQQEAPYHVEG